MKEGDIALARLPQSDGSAKTRPTLLLRQLPPFGDFLACGVSTQLHRAVPAFDEVISQGESDFALSNLKADSVIRLGFLAVLPRQKILGSIGHISPQRHARLLQRLGEYLVADLPA